MAWIESHQELARHPKTKRFARAASISIPAAIGHLHLLWWWALDFAQDGNLAGFTDEDIADATLWDGVPSIIVDALISSGFIDKSETEIMIHDWHDYAGKLITRRANEADRLRVLRTKHQQTHDVRSTNAVRTQYVAGNSTIPNSTVPNSTNITSTTPLTFTTAASGGTELAACKITGEDEPCIDGAPPNGITPSQESAMCECSDGFMRISGKCMSPVMTAEVLAQIQAGVEPPVIIYAMAQTKERGKGPAYFTGTIRRLAADGIKTKSQLDASNGKKADKPDYSDPERYKNMDMKGFKEARIDEFD